MQLIATGIKIVKRWISKIGIGLGFIAATAVGILGGIDAALMFPSIKFPIGFIIGGSSCFVNAVSYFYVVSRKDSTDTLIIAPKIIQKNTAGSTAFAIAAAFFIGTTFVANFVGMYIGFTVLGGKLNLNWPEIALQIPGVIFGVSSAVSGLIFNVKVAYALWNRIRQRAINTLPVSEHPLLMQINDSEEKNYSSINNVKLRLIHQVNEKNIVSTKLSVEDELNSPFTKPKLMKSSDNYSLLLASLGIGLMHYAENELTIAEHYFKLILNTETTISAFHKQEIRLILGIGFMSIHAYVPALLCFEALLQEKNNSAQAWLHKGCLYAAWGKTQKANRCFNKVLCIYPQHDLALAQLQALEQTQGIDVRSIPNMPEEILLKKPRQLLKQGKISLLEALQQSKTFDENKCTVIRQPSTKHKNRFLPSEAQVQLNQFIVEKTSDTISAIGDGNCTFNSLVLGICDLVLHQGLPETMGAQQLYTALFESIGLTEPQQSAFKTWLLKEPKHIKWQRVIAPILRREIISYIMNQYEEHFSLFYEEQLWIAYKNRYNYQFGDDIFIVHPHIRNKFDEDNLNKNKLIHWWQRAGQRRYFENLQQPGIESQHWGSEAEISAMAFWLGINVTWRKPSQYSGEMAAAKVGILGGLIREAEFIDAGFTHEQLKDLTAFDIIIQQFDHYFIKTFADRQMLAKQLQNLIPLQEPLIERLEQLIACAKEQNSYRFSHTTESDEFRKTLLAYKIINQTLDENTGEVIYYFINDGQGGIEEDVIRRRQHGIPENLARFILAHHQEQIPHFTVQHDGYNHWDYIAVFKDELAIQNLCRITNKPYGDEAGPSQPFTHNYLSSDFFSTLPVEGEAAQEISEDEFEYNSHSTKYSPV